MIRLFIIMQLRCKILPKITKIINELNKINKVSKINNCKNLQIESLSINLKDFSKKITFKSITIKIDLHFNKIKYIEKLLLGKCHHLSKALILLIID